MNKRVVITLLLVSSMTVLAGAIIAPSLPGLKASFEPDPGADLLAKLMLTLPALFIAVTAGLAGWLTDKMGRKPVLVVALVLYAVGGTSGLYLSDPYYLLAGRAVLGLTVGAILTVATTLAGDYFEGENRGKFLSWQAAFMAFGGTALLSLGGLLGSFSWRAPFGMYFASLLLLPLVFMLNPPRIIARKNLDTDAVPVAKIPYKAIMLVYFVGLLGQTVFYILPVQIPFFLEIEHGIGPQGVGLSLAAVTGVAGFASFYFHRMRGKRSHQVMALGAFGIMGIGFLGIAYAPGFIWLLLGLLITGFGAGWVLPNITPWLMGLAPEALRGRLVGGLTMAIFTGQFISPIILQPLIDAKGLAMALGITGAILAIGSIVFALVRHLNTPKTLLP